MPDIRRPAVIKIQNGSSKTECSMDQWHCAIGARRDR
jgi:hypothetical protein